MRTLAGSGFVEKFPSESFLAALDHPRLSVIHQQAELGNPKTETTANAVVSFNPVAGRVAACRRFSGR